MIMLFLDATQTHHIVLYMEPCLCVCVWVGWGGGGGGGGGGGVGVVGRIAAFIPTYIQIRTQRGNCSSIGRQLVSRAHELRL